MRGRFSLQTQPARPFIQSMNRNPVVKVSEHTSFTAALLAANEIEDGAVRNIDGAWCAVRLTAGTAARYNRRHARAAGRPNTSGDVGEI